VSYQTTVGSGGTCAVAAATKRLFIIFLALDTLQSDPGTTKYVTASYQ
jgi:hypothetical protein